MQTKPLVVAFLALCALPCCATQLESAVSQDTNTAAPAPGVAAPDVAAHDDNPPAFIEIPTGMITVTYALRPLLDPNAAGLDQNAQELDQNPADFAPPVGETEGSASASASATGLTSLQYNIRDIVLYTHDPRDPNHAQNPNLPLYIGPADANLFTDAQSGPNPNALQRVAYARTRPVALQENFDTGGYIDLLDIGSRSLLSATVPFDGTSIGTYRFGLVRYATPVKVDATVTAGNAACLFTHDGDTTLSADLNAPPYVTAADLSIGPSDMATVNLATDRSVFALTSPLTITPDDINGATVFTLDLLFDPNTQVQGFIGGPPSTPMLTDTLTPNGTTNANYIEVKPLRIAAVARRDQQAMVQETYVATVNQGTSDRLDLQVRIFGLADDPNATVYAVTVDAQVNAHTTLPFAPFGEVTYAQTTTRSTLTLEAFDHHPLIRGFQRQSTPGATTHATVSCTATADANDTMLANCTAPFEVTFTRQDLGQVADDVY